MNKEIKIGHAEKIGLATPSRRGTEAAASGVQLRWDRI